MVLFAEVRSITEIPREGAWERALGKAYPQLDYPGWWGDKDLHRSHRRNLIRKDHMYYRPLFPEESETSETDIQKWDYVWPVRRNGDT